MKNILEMQQNLNTNQKIRQASIKVIIKEKRSGNMEENKDIAKKLGASGREFVANNMSNKKIGSKMMAIFNKVLGNKAE